MAALTWHGAGTTKYETGVDHVALAVGSGLLKAWNGVSGITEKPSGAEATAVYADNIKYLNLISAEDFKASIEAYTYPDEFNECLGVYNDSTNAPGLMIPQQTHKKFGLMFRTQNVNADDDGISYKYHFIYNCRVGVSESAYKTINNSPEAISFSWDIETTPVDVSVSGSSSTFKSTAHLTVDGSKLTSTAIEKMESLWDDAHGMPTTTNIINACKGQNPWA